MKELFFSALFCALSVISTTHPMERLAEQEGIEIAFKDHLPTPDGGHIRVLYHPLKAQVCIGTFDSRGLMHNAALQPAINTYLRNQTDGMKKFEIAKVCGIAQHRHYLLYAVIGSIDRERDTIIFGRQDNLNDHGVYNFLTLNPGLAAIDVSSVTIGKSSLTVKNICRDNGNKNYFDGISELSHKKEFLFPDLD